MPSSPGPYDPRPQTEPSWEPGLSNTDRRGPARHPWQDASVPLMEQVFVGGAVLDPGTPFKRRVFWVIALVLIVLVTGLQQLQVMAQGAKPVPTVEPVEREASREKAPLGAELDPTDLASRIVTRLAFAFKEPGRSSANPQVQSELGNAVHPEQASDATAATRLIPAYAELAGAERGLSEIDAVRKRAERETGLSGTERKAIDETLDDLRDLYVGGSAALDGAAAKRLEERLGWSGRLALVFDLPDSDPRRYELLKNGGLLAGFLLLVSLLAIIALIAGFTLFIVALVKIGTGKLRWRLDRPAPGGSLGVEVLTVFLAAFLGLKVALSLLVLAADAGWLGAWFQGHAEAGVAAVALCAQWLILPLVMLYPSMRGYARGRVKRALGWHRGEGFLKEMLSGVAGYLACVPVYLFAVLIALVLAWLETNLRRAVTGHEPSGPVNPIGEMLSQSWWMAVLVVVLATVWAPIVEESVFRGGLFRQLNARMGMVWAALLSGTVFAMMHGYSPSLFPPLIALGAGFALIRAWRGSLVACVTAHALHNGTLTVLMLVMFSLLK